VERTWVPGIVLIALGILFLAIQAFGVGEEIAVAVIGAVFLVAYAVRREYGFLIPGAILTGLGIGVALENRVTTDNGWTVVLGLGLGFVAIYAIDVLSGATRDGQWWPLVPGGILTAIGLGLALDAQPLLDALERWWPLLLIIGGVLLLLRPVLRGRSGQRPPEESPEHRTPS
jgi:hypothetical protein